MKLLTLLTTEVIVWQIGVCEFVVYAKAIAQRNNGRQCDARKGVASYRNAGRRRHGTVGRQWAVGESERGSHSDDSKAKTSKLFCVRLFVAQARRILDQDVTLWALASSASLTCLTLSIMSGSRYIY